MNPAIPLNQSVGVRLALLVLILFLASVVAGLVAVQTLGQLQGLAEVNHRHARVRAASSWVAHLAGRVLTEEADERIRTGRELTQAVQDVRLHIEHLRAAAKVSADSAGTINAVTEVADKLEAAWSGPLRSLVDTLASTSDRSRALGALRSLDEGVRELSDALARHSAANLDRVTEASRRFQVLVYAVLALMIAATGAILITARRIVSATVQLARSAQRIASGDVTTPVPGAGSDELALLGRSLGQMTKSLVRTIEGERAARERLEQLLESANLTAEGLTAAAAQIRAGTSQQATGAQVQISAIAQTMGTVDGVLQISDRAAEWARTVADLSFRSVETGKRGRKSVDDTVAGMEKLQDHVESIAESILALSERAQAIGEIIATVNELTDQTNLLALNAAIEASRAGEQGKGFAVVASEIKTLADQSKKATAQIRQILGEIQRATSTAVATSEAGTQMVATAIEVAHQAGEVIKSLGDSIDEAAQAASQIASSADQQAAGIAQISLGIKNINQVTTQNLTAVRLAEETVHELTQMGMRLKELLAR